MAHASYSPEHGRRVSRKLDRRNRRQQEHEISAQNVLKKMRDAGVALHRVHRRDRVIWLTSDGHFIPSEVACAVLSNNRVQGVGDFLFRGTELSQTFRLIVP